MEFSRVKWEEGLKEDLTRELNRLNGVPASDLIGGPRSRLLEAVKHAMARRLAEAISRYDAATAPDVELEIVLPVGPVTPPKEKEEESEEDKFKRSRKPPSEGPCKMCQVVKPLNRLLLCYSCWLKDKIHKDSGGSWLPGDPHPQPCGCDGLGGCSTKFQGN